jgi:hypothetical protein
MIYTGTSDGAAAGKRAGTEKFVKIIKKKGFTNLGTWAVRNMRGSDRLSVHATGRAADIGYKDKATAALWANWLVANYEVLGIEECTTTPAPQSLAQRNGAAAGAVTATANQAGKTGQKPLTAVQAAAFGFMSN